MVPPSRLFLRPAAALLVGGALVGAAPAAEGATPRPAKVPSSPLLWATVNVCDTIASPDTIGLRVSMPVGKDGGERMWVRFRLEYFDAAGNRWRSIGRTGDSGFTRVLPPAAGRYQALETGRNFTVRPPRTGGFVLRGRVSFEWRKGKRVLRSTVLKTRSGHPNTKGADPSGFSAATCEVTA